jgi:hypothetical protein
MAYCQSQMPIANRHWTFNPLVLSGAPNEPGVYALFEDDEIVYYGCAVQGSTIQSALHEVLMRVRAGQGGCLQRVNRYSWEITHRPRLREAELLREFEQAHQRPPRCNQAPVGQPEVPIVAGQRRCP